MNRRDIEEIVLSDIKRLCFIVVASSLILFVVGRIFSLNWVHYVVSYCSFSLLSVIIFRRPQESRYSIILFFLFGFALAYLRNSELIPVLGSHSLGFLLLLTLGLVAVVVTMALDIVLSKDWARKV